MLTACMVALNAPWALPKAIKNQSFGLVTHQSNVRWNTKSLLLD